jgi:hypothetical protein
MRVGFQRRHTGGENFSLVFECVAFEHTLDDLNALAHDGCWPNLLPFTFANFFHKDFRSAKPEKEAVCGKILHDARFHGDLIRVTRVRRNNSPAQLNFFRLRGDDRQDGSRGARFEPVLAPPWISFSDPEAIETSVFARFRHGNGFVNWFHAELQDADVEGDGHLITPVLSSQFSVLGSPLLASGFWLHREATYVLG